MIKGTLANYKHFLKIRPDFNKAFNFLARKDINSLPDGKYPIDGDVVFAVISGSDGKGIKNSKLEAHRKYIDIQYIISGKELIGINRLSDCLKRAGNYDSAKDIIFFTEKPKKYIKLKTGEFAIFFPDDAHAPLAGKTPVRKAVIKVASKESHA